MELLTNTAFLQMLLDPDPLDMCLKELDSLYHEFTNTLTRICDKESDYKHLFRLLNFAIIQLKLIDIGNKQPLVQRYFYATEKILESELHLLDEQANHPNRFLSHSPLRQYNFHLSKRYTKHDLTELISSLECAEFFVDNKGDAIPYIRIVSAFEELANIKLPNPFNIRTKILDRKTNPIKFLRVLSESRIEKSQK